MQARSNKKNTKEDMSPAVHYPFLTEEKRAGWAVPPRTVLDLPAEGVEQSFLGVLAVPQLEVSGAILKTQVSHPFFFNTDDW